MEIKIPEIGESILEALVANWLKQDGDSVNKDELICELETDKINVELNAEAAGVLHIKVAQGETVPIGTVIATLEEGETAAPLAAADEGAPAEQAAAPGAASEPAPAAPGQTAPANPVARQKATELGIDLADVSGSGRDGRVTLEDVLAHKTTAGTHSANGAGSAAAQPQEQPAPQEQQERERPQEATQPAIVPSDDGRPVSREAMTPIRRRIAARLLEARQQTAMLTTFNEADMTWVKKLRGRHQESFVARHGVKLGFMSFFVKACVEALREFPAVNARIDGSDIVYHHYYDIGIAVGTDRGLVVPILRDADRLTFAEIEQQIAELAKKANARKLTLADLEGGTFTISNGGIYGSLLSTPIINPPQCGVLGMHSIQERAVVRDGEIVIRPIMNLALSYDHRLIDGREAVGFLKLVKEYIEDPSELFLEM
jgi:2-oxoglutarate dehydrogenase E2 component (dihydrolipoamide succinyltransferase)